MDREYVGSLLAESACLLEGPTFDRVYGKRISVRFMVARFARHRLGSEFPTRGVGDAETPSFAGSRLWFMRFVRFMRDIKSPLR